jgi:predicted double-glycine peptidase
MLNFQRWLENQEKIPEGAIKVHLPHGRMQKAGSCGAMAFRAICRFFNVGPEDENDFMKILGTSEKNGTPPESIVKHAKEFGFQVRAKTEMEVEDLMNFLDQGIPVICAMQAWGSSPKHYENNESGHYVVVVGYTVENIYFEDPSISEKRGFLPVNDFFERWHDIDAHGHHCNRMGIAMWMKTPKKINKITKAKKIE